MRANSREETLVMAECASLAALYLRILLCVCLIHSTAGSCDETALGMANGYIVDSEITSSPVHNSNTQAKNGRLNYTGGSSWCASASDISPYLQIDLEIRHIICAVATQGNSQADQWVKKYKLQFSADSITWYEYKERGKSKILLGNFDRRNIVKHVLFAGISARYLRILPDEYHVGVCLRVELYGMQVKQENFALYKPTSQSSTGGNSVSSKAVDGNRNTNIYYCTHTLQSTDPWWRVDLGKVESVSDLYIVNRGDCCGYRLSGFEIRVGNATAGGGVSNHLCGSGLNVPQGEGKAFYCKPVARGRYVYIRIPGSNKILTLCGVEVYGVANLALKQPAVQSSTVGSNSGLASWAVDGKASTNWGDNTCSHTNTETDPWWRVDLGSSFPVAEIFIVNRGDCGGACADRFKGFEIRIGNNDDRNGGVSNPQCGTGLLNLDSGQKKSFFCLPRLAGRYVYIRIPGSGKTLTICELEIYTRPRNYTACSTEPVGIADSSTIPNYRLSASSSRSGNEPYNGRLRGNSAWFPSTNADSNDYLQIDLGSVYFVCAVATQGNPTNTAWTTKYKIETSLNNVDWTTYKEDNTEKIFDGNNDRSSILKRNLNQSPAARFVRFYPTGYNGNKTLRVEVYGTMERCQASLGMEDDDIPDSSITVSSHLDSSHTKSSSRLYSSSSSWCSSTSSTSEYLQVDLGHVKTLTGVATQGDPSSNKWVTKYNILYGYDGKTWDTDALHQGLTGNTDKSSVVVNWFSVPFAARIVKVVPLTWNTAVCLRVDFYGCDHFIVPFLYIAEFADVTLPTQAVDRSAVLRVQAEFSNQRPAKFSWSNNGNSLSETASAITVKYTSAVQTWNNYRCVRRSLASRDIYCNTTYSCSVFVPDIPIFAEVVQANVTALLSVPGRPTVQVIQGDIKARTITVRWIQPSPGADEAPIRYFTLQYTNQSFSSTLTISPPFTANKQLTNLKPYTDYRVKMMAYSILGNGLWSDTKTFTTLTAEPSSAPQGITRLKINETTYNITWQPLSQEKSNGRILTYEVKRSEVSASRQKRSLPSFYKNTTATFFVLFNLKVCTKYEVEVRAYTTAGPGSFGATDHPIETSAPDTPTSLEKLSQTKRSVKLKWKEPDSGDYQLTFTIMYKGTKDYYPEFKHVRVVSRIQTTEYALKDLYPGTKYEFSVSATSRCGVSDNSSILPLETEVDAPVAPDEGEILDVTTSQTTANVTLRTAPQDNGPISNYQVIVFRVKDWTDTVTEAGNSEPDYSESIEKTLDYYVTAQFTAGSLKPPWLFVVGDDELYGSFKNAELSRGQKYKVFNRAITKDGSQTWYGAERLVAQIHVEQEKNLVDDSRTDPSTGVVSVGVIAAVVVIIIILVLVGIVGGVCLCKRRRQAEGESTLRLDQRYSVPMANVPSYTCAEQETAKEIEHFEGGVYSYVIEPDDDGEDEIEPVSVDRFAEYVNRLRRGQDSAMKEQYQRLNTGQLFSWDVAKKPENKAKNRYGNIIAYDHSRIVLPLISNEEHSDYINANYVHGFDGAPKTYIACQGPVTETFYDFWRMVWLEKPGIIVMLTRLIENSRVKCHQYWPEDKQQYGDITVVNHKTETFADYVVRTFVITKSGTTERRHVRQFHFLVWPEKGVPQHATAVLGLRRRVRALHRNSKCPLLVHCSGGISRTGAFIVIDAMLEKAKQENVVDVFNYVQMIRNDRISMVQTEEQFIFVYMAILEALTCGNTEISTEDLRIVVEKLSVVNPKTRVSGFGSEFQRLELITCPSVTEKMDDIGRKSNNAAKNRFPHIVPLNESRVKLKSDEEGSYINASFVDAFRKRDAFIMTQAPLKTTTTDFWQMIWDYNICTIVMLNELQEKGQVYSVYWPNEGRVTYDKFTVEFVSQQTFEDFRERIFKLTFGEGSQAERQVRHYQVTGWPEKGVLANLNGVFDLAEMIEQSQRKCGTAPAVVQCSNGVGRSGTLCAVLSVLDRLKSEQVLDIFQAVKVLRIKRPGAVETTAQYVFCYNIVQTYLDSLADYST